MSRWLALVVTALFSISPPALGAEVKVEGVLKAVDAKERTLTVEKKTAKGTKELSLEVAEEAGDLASLKEGDEVSLAYDSTLEVVTKIVSPFGRDGGDAKREKVVRYRLDISDTGEATAHISLVPKTEAKNERVDLGEGVWRRSHGFENQGDAKPLMKGLKRDTEHVSVNAETKALEMRPGQTTGYGSPIGSHIWYPVIFSPPLSLEVDLDLAEKGWELDFFPHVADLPSERNTFFSLAVHDKSANRFRFYVREMNGQKSRDLFNDVVDLGKPIKKSFRLPVPNAKSNDPYLFQISCGPNNPVTAGSQGGALACRIHRLQFTGKPCPIYGMRLAEQPGRVFVQEVVKASSAETAGIQEGDVVLAIDATPVADRNGAMALLRSHACGQPCAVKVLRGDDQKTITMDWELP